MDLPTTTVTGESFRFLDLPTELRMMVYESIPREIKHIRLLTREAHWTKDKSSKVGELETTLVSHSMSTAILGTCRQISIEANDVVKATMQNWVADQGIGFISNMIDGTVDAMLRCIISRFCWIVKDEELECHILGNCGFSKRLEDSYEYGKFWLDWECPDAVTTRQLHHSARQIQHPVPWIQ
jgi:hypothetical protein